MTKREAQLMCGFFVFLIYGIVRLVVYSEGETHTESSSSGGGGGESSGDSSHHRSLILIRSSESEEPVACHGPLGAPQPHVNSDYPVPLATAYDALSILQLLFFFIAFGIVVYRRGLVFNRSFIDHKIHNLFISFLTVVYLAFTSYNVVYNFQNVSTRGAAEGVKSLCDVIFGVVCLNIEVFGKVIPERVNINGSDTISTLCWLYMTGVPLFEFAIYFLMPIFHFQEYQDYINSFSETFSSLVLSALRPLTIAFLFDMFGSFLTHFFTHGHGDHGDHGNHGDHNGHGHNDSDQVDDIALDNPSSLSVSKQRDLALEEEDEPDISYAGGINNNQSGNSNWKQLDLMYTVIIIPIFFSLLAFGTGTSFTSSNPCYNETTIYNSTIGDDLLMHNYSITEQICYNHSLGYIQIAYHSIYIVLTLLCFACLYYIPKFKVKSFHLPSVYLIEFFMLVATGLMSLGTNIAVIYLLLNYDDEHHNPDISTQIADQFFAFINVILQMILIFWLFVGSLDIDYAVDFNSRLNRYAVYYVHWFIHSLPIYNILWLFLGVILENSLHEYSSCTPKTLVAAIEVMLPLAIEFRTTYAKLSAMYGFRTKKSKDEAMDRGLNFFNFFFFYIF